LSACLERDPLACIFGRRSAIIEHRIVLVDQFVLGGCAVPVELLLLSVIDSTAVLRNFASILLLVHL